MSNTIKTLLLGMALTLLAGCSKPSPDEVFQEAANLLMQKNFVSARHRLEELVKDYPDYDLIPEVKLTIADCFNFEQKPDDAEVIYKEILTESPKTIHSWKARIRLGDMSRNDKRFEDAEAYFSAAIEDTTDEGARLTAMNNLVRTFQEAGNKDKAMEMLSRMVDAAQDPTYKMRIAIQKVNALLTDKKKEEAWATLLSIYNAKFPPEIREDFFSSLVQTAPHAGKIRDGSRFFDSVINAATDDELRSEASYYNSMLSAASEPLVATGVFMLKRVHELFPKTNYGRWAPVEAARAMLAHATSFPDATGEAKTLFDTALKSYDDIINDMTIEWFEPQKAAWAWSQIGTIYELRSQHLESLDDLKSASKTIAEIPKRFGKALPQEVEVANNWRERVAYKIHIAESSPEFFWEQIRLARAGKLRMPTEEAEAPASASLGSSTAAAAISSATVSPATATGGK